MSLKTYPYRSQGEVIGAGEGEKGAEGEGDRWIPSLFSGFDMVDGEDELGRGEVEGGGEF